MAVAVGTRAAAELKIVVMLVITAEAPKVVRERQTGRAAKARTSLGSERDGGYVVHEQHMEGAACWIRRSGKLMNARDEERGGSCCLTLGRRKRARSFCIYIGCCCVMNRKVHTTPAPSPQLLGF